jgi:hypothetical protein
VDKTPLQKLQDEAARALGAAGVDREALDAFLAQAFDLDIQAAKERDAFLARDRAENCTCPCQSCRLRQLS